MNHFRAASSSTSCGTVSGGVAMTARSGVNGRPVSSRTSRTSAVACATCSAVACLALLGLAVEAGREQLGV